MILARLFLWFLIGLATWLLTFGRSLAFRRLQPGRLIAIVFADEVIALTMGMWLAREGTIFDAIGCALGGSMAVLIMMKRLKCQQPQS